MADAARGRASATRESAGRAALDQDAKVEGLRLPGARDQVGQHLNRSRPGMRRATPTRRRLDLEVAIPKKPETGRLKHGNPNPTARIHHAHRRRGGRMAVRGAGAD
jgi:hypothetical protein